MLRLVEWGELLVHVYMTVLHYLVNGDDTCLCVYMLDVISLFGAQGVSWDTWHLKKCDSIICLGSWG